MAAVLVSDVFMLMFC